MIQGCVYIFAVQSKAQWEIMQIERRSNGSEKAYFVTENQELLGSAQTLQDALARRVTPVENPEAWTTRLVPCEPTKIVCIGLNYRQHAEEMSKSIPDAPLMFLKPPSALLADGGTIVRPAVSKEVHYEAELAVVIAQTSKDLAIEDVPRAIAGYTLFNDVTARDLQRKDVQYTRGKGFDTFAVVGPRIVTGIAPDALEIRLRLNGETRQSSPVSDMIFSVHELVAYVSQMMTLMPGDVIATGTPSGVGELHAGDVVEVEIEEIGVLRNAVRDA